MATALPGKYDFAAYRGDTKQWTIAFTDSDGAPVNMAAWEWEAQIRATLDEPDSIVATLTVDGTGAATGDLGLTLPAAESDGLVTVDGRATYYWDLQGTDGSVVKTWLAGKVKVTGDVTVSA